MADYGREVLAAQSKDLEIAAYVIEAVTRTEGFQGLELRRLQATRLMVENFWDHLYPLPEVQEGDRRQPGGPIRSQGRASFTPEWN